jgi:hypothetical protein
MVVGRGRGRSRFTELAEHRIDGVEGRVYFLPNLMPGRKQGGNVSGWSQTTSTELETSTTGIDEKN